jgi:hypothetical protein
MRLCVGVKGLWVGDKGLWIGVKMLWVGDKGVQAQGNAATTPRETQSLLTVDCA